MKKPQFYWFIFAAVAGLIAGLGIRNRAARLGFAAAAPVPPVGSRPLRPPQAVDDEGNILIRLSAVAQAHLGIQVARLERARARQRTSLPAMVAPVAGLVSLVGAYQAADAQVRKAQIAANVAKQEYVRLEELYKDQRNTSAKAVEAQAGIYHSDEVDVRTARQGLALALASIRRNWGPVVEKWEKRGSVTLQDVLARREVLVELTLPFGAHYAPPSVVGLELPAGGRALAKLVSAFPQVDPRVQGVDFIYLTRGRPGLVPEVNLVAHFGVGLLETGVRIPSSAVVWKGGQAWAYVAIAAHRFERRRVATQVPIHGGWFEARHFVAGERIVTGGAEELLAVESSSASGSSGNRGGE
jgi:hypothetical protein